MAHAAAYVPIALIFLVLIICLICHSSPVPIDRAEVEERGLRLLRSWLSPKQAQQWDALNEFEVVGSHTGTRYRIRRGKTMNVHELDRAGNIVAHWCFAPQGDLPMGDVLLGQKIALETMERDACGIVERAGGVLPADKIERLGRLMLASSVRKPGGTYADLR
jgi:hypothetical protein